MRKNIYIFLFFTFTYHLSFSQYFITKWKTDNPGNSNNTSIIIPTLGSGYNFDIDWENDGVFDDLGVTGNITHDYGTIGIYEVAIRGNFPKIRFTDFTDSEKIISIEQWGNQQWTTMQSAFSNCSNLIINASDSPDLSNVTDMSFMFYGCSSFNQDISSWNVEHVTKMTNLFKNAYSFNQPLNNWDTSNITQMSGMFLNAFSFNQPLNNWNTVNVTNMSNMFNNASSFNQNIGNWNTSSLSGTGLMFSNAISFDQNLGNWNISNLTSAGLMFENVMLSYSNYDSLLIGWQSQPHNNNVTFDGGHSQYCNAENERSSLISDGWIISDKGKNYSCTGIDPNYFITTWKTDNIGVTNNTSIEIPTIGGGYNYDIDWENDGVFDDFGIAGSITHNYGASGVYTVAIRGDFPRIYFNNPNFYYDYTSDSHKFLGVNQWGTQIWSSMENAFSGTHFIEIASDIPNLTNVSSMKYMFAFSSFNQKVNLWDVENVTDMSFMFFNNGSFNQLLNSWNTQNVTNMESMFQHAYSFNQALDLWDTTYVTNMRKMFKDTPFNHPINSWNVSNVTNMSDMFAVNYDFNQPLNSWSVGNVIDMSLMFRRTKFNQSIDSWNVESVTDMHGMFGSSKYNQPLNSWNVGNVVNMYQMFVYSKFNQPINIWNVENVTNMSSMFQDSFFNQPLNSWNTVSVTNMYAMFKNTNNFNQPIDSWDTSNVQTMQEMFYNAESFNQPLNSWNVSNVENMYFMFSESNFNQPLDLWNTESVTNMHGMFAKNPSFDQSLGSWNVENVTNMSFMFYDDTLSTPNYDNLLIGWNNQNLQPNIVFDGGYSKYCEGASARANMISSDNWNIGDGGADSDTTLPTFTQINPICLGDFLNDLPTTSNNGVEGSWSPPLNNLNTTEYTFTPISSQCASDTTMTIVVNQKTTPIFTQINAICEGELLNNLPITSNNGIEGSWTPAIDNTTTTEYTFTPNTDQCALSTTMTIHITPQNTIPIFDQINSICEGETLNNLPTISNNGIEGSWSPSINNTTTTEYTFTPNSTQCSLNTHMTIVVNQKATPIFTQVNAICTGAFINNLPTTSNNGIEGSWTPAIDNTTTTEYTFTPNTDQCAYNTTMTIFVHSQGTIPTFDQVDSICLGETINSLPLMSNNGVTGSWSPSINNINTTEYTFTPNSGQCAINTTMTVIVNDIDTPIFTPISPICIGETINLPPISNNGIEGNWSPEINNTTTTEYTFTPLNNCNEIIQMNIIVNPLPDIDTLDNVIANNNYKLPSIQFGNYFTESNGNGIPLQIGDTIDSSQIIYIYSNDGECSNESSFNIIIETKLIIPRFFTPNGDTINDTWKVNDIDSKIISISIWDRFGKILSILNKKNNYFEWNGTYNGKLLNENDYWYIITLKNGKQLKGNITLKISS